MIDLTDSRIGQLDRSNRPSTPRGLSSAASEAYVRQANFPENLTHGLLRTPFPRNQVHVDGLDRSAPLACSQQQASDKGDKRDPTARQPLLWERLQGTPAPRTTRHSFRAGGVRHRRGRDADPRVPREVEPELQGACARNRGWTLPPPPRVERHPILHV